MDVIQTLSDIQKLFLNPSNSEGAKVQAITDLDEIKSFIISEDKAKRNLEERVKALEANGK